MRLIIFPPCLFVSGYCYWFLFVCLLFIIAKWNYVTALKTGFRDSLFDNPNEIHLQSSQVFVSVRRLVILLALLCSIWRLGRFFLAVVCSFVVLKGSKPFI